MRHFQVQTLVYLSILLWRALKVLSTTELPKKKKERKKEKGQQSTRLGKCFSHRLMPSGIWNIERSSVRSVTWFPNNTASGGCSRAHTALLNSLGLRLLYTLLRTATYCYQSLKVRGCRDWRIWSRARVTLPWQRLLPSGFRPTITLQHLPITFPPTRIGPPLFPTADWSCCFSSSYLTWFRPRPFRLTLGLKLVISLFALKDCH